MSESTALVLMPKTSAHALDRGSGRHGTTSIGTPRRIVKDTWGCIMRGVASKTNPPARPLTLPDTDLAAIQKRLRRVEGQIGGIQRMLEARADCHAIVQQMSAARGALERAMVEVIVGSLADCLRTDDGKVDDENIHSVTASFARLL